MVLWQKWWSKSSFESDIQLVNDDCWQYFIYFMDIRTHNDNQKVILTCWYKSLKTTFVVRSYVSLWLAFVISTEVPFPLVVFPCVRIDRWYPTGFVNVVRIVQWMYSISFMSSCCAIAWPCSGLAHAISWTDSLPSSALVVVLSKVGVPLFTELWHDVWYGILQFPVTQRILRIVVSLIVLVVTRYLFPRWFRMADSFSPLRTRFVAVSWWLQNWMENTVFLLRNWWFPPPVQFIALLYIVCVIQIVRWFGELITCTSWHIFAMSCFHLTCFLAFFACSSKYSIYLVHFSYCSLWSGCSSRNCCASCIVSIQADFSSSVLVSAEQIKLLS